MQIDFSRVTPRLSRRLIAAPLLAIGLIGCGGTDEVSAVAAENATELTEAADVRDFEVLSVQDGSITTLRDTVDGDRPVLLWFWAPH